MTATKQPKKYSFDDHPDHKTALEPWAQQWIHNAMTTDPADQNRMRAAMAGLYQAADLTPPPDHRGQFVRSPMTAAIAGTVAAGVWWLRENPAKHVELFGRLVSEAEMMSAIPVACRIAVERGMAALRGEPVPPGPQLKPTDAATDDATYAATRAATDDATRDATYAAARFLLQCAPRWYRMYNGGSDWSAWPAYLSFFRHIAGLDLPSYDKWRHYEDAARYAAGRMIHAKFWIVSDRHTHVHVDPERRLHREDGPARAWGDGWAIWYWHGTRVPRDLIEDGWDSTRILREPNAEVRRCAIERMGWPQFVADAGLTQVGAAQPDPGNPGYTIVLYDVPEQIYDEAIRVLLCTNGTEERDGTRRSFGLTVPASIPTALAAAAWGYGLNPGQYAHLARRT